MKSVSLVRSQHKLLEDNMHGRHTLVPKETPLEKRFIRRVGARGERDGLERKGEASSRKLVFTGYTEGPLSSKDRMKRKTLYLWQLSLFDDEGLS